MEGKGIIRFASGNVYEGDYKNGNRTGKGKFICFLIFFFSYFLLLFILIVFFVFILDIKINIQIFK
jgi:hypothetical protein